MTQKTPRYSISTVIPIVLLMVAAEAISKFGLSGLSLRFDESQSILQAKLSPLHIINLVAQDVHIPLYDLMLHYWMMCCGFTVMAGRAFSLILLLLSIPVIYILGRQIFDSTASLFATATFALSPFMNWYGNEMRMYTLLTFVVMLNQYFFIGIFQHKGHVFWLGYLVTASVGIFVHYFFLLVPFAQAIFFLLYWRHFPRMSFRRFLGIALILTALFGVWVQYVVRVQHIFSQNRPSSWAPVLPPTTTVDVFNVFSQFLFGFQADPVNTILVSSWPLIVLLGLLTLSQNAKAPPEIVYYLISVVVPIGTVFLLSVAIRPMFLSRYFIYALPSLCLLIAWIVSVYPTILAMLVKASLILAIVGAMVLEVASPATPVKEDYRAAVQYMQANATSRDVIIISAPFTRYPVDYYYRGTVLIATLPIWNQMAGALPQFNESELANEVEQLRRHHEKAYLLLSYDQGYEKNITAYFERNFDLELKQIFSPHLYLYVYDLRHAPVRTSQSVAAPADLHLRGGT